MGGGSSAGWTTCGSLLGNAPDSKLSAMDDAPSPRRRTVPLTADERRHLWWAVPPLAVLFVANLFFELAGGGYARVGAQVLATTAAKGDTARDAVGAAAAISWATLALVYLCVSAGATVGAWRIINERVQGRARRPFTLFTIGATVLGLMNLVAVNVTQSPLLAVFAVTFDALVTSSAIGPARVAVIGAVVALINVMSVLVPALLLAAAAASALPPVAGWNETTLSRRALQVRHIVALAAAFMVAGVLHMGAWTHWVGASLQAAGDVALDQVAVTVTLFWGTTFTLMIASFYLPVAVRLGELAEAIMDDAGIALAERPKWLAERGLSFRLSEQLPQIAAMAAPVLAGPLSAAIGAFADTALR
jgi:hypothetical protein